MDLLLVLLPGNVGDIHTVIPDPLQVTDGIQDLAHHKLVICRETPLIDPYDVRGQCGLALIEELLICFHFREPGCIIGIDHAGGHAIILTDRIRHLLDQFLTLLQCDGRSIEKHVIQFRKFQGLGTLFLLSSQFIADPGHKLGSDHQDDACDQVEHQVDRSDTAPVDRFGEP